MFGANAMWGIMSPVSKMVMAGSIISPMVVTDCRVLGAARSCSGSCRCS